MNNTKSFIVCDARADFQKDIYNTLMLEDYTVRIYQTQDIESTREDALKHPDADIILSENVALTADLSVLPRPAYGYAVTPNGTASLNALGIPSIGFCNTSESLIKALSNDPLAVIGSWTHNAGTPNAAAQAPQTQQSPATASSQAPQPAQQPVQQPQPQQQTTPVQPAAAPVQQPVQQMPGMQGFTPEMMQQMMNMFQMMQNGGNMPMPSVQPQEQPQVQQPVQPQVQQPVQPAAQNDEENEPEQEPEPAKRRRGEKKKKQSAGSEMREQRKQKQDAVADEEIDEDIGSPRMRADGKATVVTVYAAKGGVGKTTISSELAVCLALTSNGRRKFRVCVVDYNIDFGDISTMLEFQDDGPNMSYWASEIRELIAGGQAPESINYTREEMETHYLQKMQDTGLYALCAPIAHEDSMLIKSQELQTMLRNIIENGEFDFVICDTGNNTRDSSIIAIDNADYILLVATQDVTTANCNASVLRTLRDSGFDTDKIRLIVNQAMSARETGISVQEVEETFPYKCICRIKRTPDIIKANNLCTPLVYKPNHEFTKQIQRIVRFVTAGDVSDEPVKRGLFGFNLHG